MNPVLTLILTILAPALLSFWLGRALAEGLPLERSEKIAVSFGFSFFGFYLVGLAGYLADVSPFWLHLGASAVATIFAAWVVRRRGRAVAGLDELRALLGFGTLFLGYVMLQGIFAVYGGGGWYGDWYEHYHRSRFFLDCLPLDTKFLGIYWLPARPPLFNVVTYYFQALLGEPFWVFQVLSTFLNLVVVFPLWLICRRLISNDRPWLWWAVLALAALSPIVLRHATYPWPRLLTAYYVLLALYFYLKARPTGDPRLTVLAFGLGALGILTHYSAFVSVVPMAVDCLLLALWRPRVQWRPLAGSALAGAMILAPWFGWAFAIYGPRITLASNTTVEWTRDMGLAQRAEMAWFNFRSTVLPYPLWGFVDAGEITRESRFGAWLAGLPGYITQHFAILVPGGGEAGTLRDRVFGVFTQSSKLGLWSDRLLLFHQATFLGNLTPPLALSALGVWAGARIQALLSRSGGNRKSLKHDPRSQPRAAEPFWVRESSFWAFFWPSAVALALLVTPEFEFGGIAHIALQAPLLWLTCAAFTSVIKLRLVWLRITILPTFAMESIITTALMLGVLGWLPPFVWIPAGQLLP